MDNELQLVYLAAAALMNGPHLDWLKSPDDPRQQYANSRKFGIKLFRKKSVSGEWYLTKVTKLS